MKKNSSKKILLTLSSIGAAVSIFSPILVAASCSHELPVLSISEDPKYSFINEKRERVIKGSAKEFYDLNTQFVFNPVNSNDKRYPLFINGKININNSAKNEPYKIKPNFAFLKFDNLTPRYDYRLFSFTYDELVANLPGVSTRSKYAKYRNDPRAVFVVLYWVAKTSEAAPNFENDIIAPSRARFTNAPANIEEAPWPFLKDISNDLRGFWKDVIEPVVLIFERE
ncbi:hypothetical protein [Metamycoplasma canadense]|uniref:Lipoprotein n=1 Tax=Metamycoplasma canadense TaxID=29554 RepID=A0A077L8Q3_9BACT|nr:hypothetical protein [Metamycoplasma canadense]BAP39418.1 hypothetical protein MCAN360_0166 [Metamycoplasma canadense]